MLNNRVQKYEIIATKDKPIRKFLHDEHTVKEVEWGAYNIDFSGKLNQKAIKICLYVGNWLFLWQ